MNKDFSFNSPSDAFVEFFQAVQVGVKAISGLGSSDAPDRAALTALAAAGGNMDRCLKAAQDAMFRSITLPIPTTVFDTFVDNFGEING